MVALTLCDGQLDVVNRFKYFENLIAPGDVGEVTTSRTLRIEAAFANLPRPPPMWRRHGIQIILKGLHNATVCALFHDCGARLFALNMVDGTLYYTIYVSEAFAEPGLNIGCAKTKHCYGRRVESRPVIEIIAQHCLK